MCRKHCELQRKLRKDKREEGVRDMQLLYNRSKKNLDRFVGVQDLIVVNKMPFNVTIESSVSWNTLVRRT